MELPHTEKSLTISLVIFDTIHECDQTDGHTKTAIALCTASNSKNQQNKKKYLLSSVWRNIQLLFTRFCSITDATTSVPAPATYNIIHVNYITITTNVQSHTCTHSGWVQQAPARTSNVIYKNGKFFICITDYCCILVQPVKGCYLFNWPSRLMWTV